MVFLSHSKWCVIRTFAQSLVSTPRHDFPLTSPLTTLLCADEEGRRSSSEALKLRTA
jgi:hypothetical protein